MGDVITIYSTVADYARKKIASLERELTDTNDVERQDDIRKSIEVYKRILAGQEELGH